MTLGIGDLEVWAPVTLAALPADLDLTTRNALEPLVGRRGVVEDLGSMFAYVRFDDPDDPTYRGALGRWWIRPRYLER